MAVRHLCDPVRRGRLSSPLHLPSVVQNMDPRIWWRRKDQPNLFSRDVEAITLSNFRSIAPEQLSTPRDFPLRDSGFAASRDEIIEPREHVVDELAQLASQPGPARCRDVAAVERPLP